MNVHYTEYFTVLLQKLFYLISAASSLQTVSLNEMSNETDIFADSLQNVMIDDVDFNANDVFQSHTTKNLHHELRMPLEPLPPLSLSEMLYAEDLEHLIDNPTTSLDPDNNFNFNYVHFETSVAPPIASPSLSTIKLKTLSPPQSPASEMLYAEDLEHLMDTPDKFNYFHFQKSMAPRIASSSSSINKLTRSSSTRLRFKCRWCSRTYSHSDGVRKHAVKCHLIDMHRVRACKKRCASQYCIQVEADDADCVFATVQDPELGSMC
jgi:hypothetical protein